MDRSAIEINLVHAKTKKPGVAAPGFLIVLAVSRIYLSSHLQI